MVLREARGAKECGTGTAFPQEIHPQKLLWQLQWGSDHAALGMGTEPHDQTWVLCSDQSLFPQNCTVVGNIRLVP